MGIGLLLVLDPRRGGAPRARSEDDLLARQGPLLRAKQGAGKPLEVAAPVREVPAADDVAPDDSLSLWQKRLERAQRTLDTYLETTRYPPTSRPLSEEPDQARPHFVSDETVPLKRRDDKLTDARATLRQDRYYLVGEERVSFAIACATSDGPAACEVLSTRTRVGVDAGAPTAEASILFTAGQGGALAATFQPSTQGFAGVYGPIRLFIDLRVAGEEGQVSFGVMYTPAAPAVLTGALREALEDGSLDLFAGIEVMKPGRYVISARVDDAEGRSFAYLSFNEVLGAGAQEVRLRLFGRLILDQKARAPFRVRDIEGFLLKEDVYPDREMMATLEGLVYTTKRHAARDFSDRAWESPEKERHVAELTRSMAEAKARVGRGD